MRHAVPYALNVAAVAMHSNFYFGGGWEPALFGLGFHAAMLMTTGMFHYALASGAISDRPRA